VCGQRIDPGTLLTYQGMMLDGVPNLAMAFGYANASWTLKSDLTSRFVAGLLNHMDRNDLKVCTPLNGGVADVDEPIMGLSSGYVQRATGSMPRQGEAAPWRVAHSYLADRRTLACEPWRHDPSLSYS